MNIKTFEAGARLALFLSLLISNTAGAVGYTLTLSANGSGTVFRNPTNATYPPGVVVTISATPDAGWYFANWSGDTNGSVNPLNVTMNGNLVINGNFLAYPTYSLALITNGQGTISLSQPGGSYSSNTVVIATATPASGWVFTGWSGATNTSVNPVSLTLNASATLTGNFAQLPAFDVQPVSVTNQSGSTVSFMAHAVGTAPLGYQWFFSGGSLTNASNPTLTLTNISSGQAGNYWIIATNSYGSATSQMASLSITNSGGPTNVVNSADETSLRAAIALGGWIGLGFNGAITLTSTITITNHVVLDGKNVTAILSGGNAVRLFYVTPGASLTATNLTLANGSFIMNFGVSGTVADAGAIFNDGGTVTLVSCTVTNNSAQALVNGGIGRGGAIFNNGGNVSLYNSLLVSNSAVGGASPNTLAYPTVGTGLGGVLFNTNGSLIISGCLVNGNLAQGICAYSAFEPGTSLAMGGAVFHASGSTMIAQTSFTLNQALGGNGVGSPAFDAGPAYGGAVAATGGSVIFDHSQFTNNQAVGGSGGYHGQADAAYGGGVYSTADGSAFDCTFAANQALAGGNSFYVNDPAQKGRSGYGGAIYNAGNLKLNRCLVSANSAQGGGLQSYPNTKGSGGDGQGGGIFNANLLAATNCTVALNASLAGNGSVYQTLLGTNGNTFGGGIFNFIGATTRLMNCTVASNFCVSGGAGYTANNGFVCGAQIANTNGTLRVHNSLIAYSDTNSNAYGPITDEGFNICSDGSAGFASGSSYNFTDPKLASLADNGGPTLTMALLPISPAIDFGDSAGIPNTDQRSYPRPFGTGVDIGAFEYGSYLLILPTLNIAPAGTNMMLTYTTTLTGAYRLQASTNLSAWTDLITNGPFASPTNLTQTISKQGFKNRYFRLLIQ